MAIGSKKSKSPFGNMEQEQAQRSASAYPADAALQKKNKRRRKRRKAQLPAEGKSQAPDSSEAPQAGEGRLVGYEQVERLRGQERRALRRKAVLCIALTVVLGLVSCMVLSYVTSIGNTNDTYVGLIVTPSTALMLLQQALSEATGGAVAAPDGQLGILLFNNPNGQNWTDTISLIASWEVDRVLTTLMCVFGGALLGLSGMLYQNVFRNPIATPTMLGVQSGVNLGTLVMVALFGAAAVDMIVPRYLVCYAFGIGMLLLVFAGGKLIAGRRPFSVVDLLLVGTAVGSIAGVVTQYIPAGWDEGTWNAYYTLSEALRTGTSPAAFASVAVIYLVAVLPIFLLRWKLNALSFSNVEVRLLGIDPSRLRMVALVAGSLMILVAMVTVGAVGLMAVIVPFVARYWFGSEAREQFWGNLLLGPLVLVFCRLLCDVLECAFPILGTSLSMGTVVSVLLLPVFVWVVASHQRGWE